MKDIASVHGAPQGHWVGDGFPVRSLFAYPVHGKALSPFLLLDYAGPADFNPAAHPRGVGPHPHRGFETVSIVFQGEVAHRDSTGKGGVIGPGDVQWMTAGAGILHEEFHSESFTRAGGPLEMAQLWVNLPARDKLAPPAYQAILAGEIPSVPLAGSAGSARIIAGEFAGHRGPARTFTPMEVWDLRLRAGTRAELPAREGWHTALVVLRGTVRVNDQATVGEAQVVVLDPAGTGVQLVAGAEAKLLLLSGEPIDEPIVGHGPFVMNTREQIAQALEDFESGAFGTLGR